MISGNAHENGPTGHPTACLNCGSALAGPFCARCGQRNIPAYPTIREFAGDAWQELSGWDGRFNRTVRTLLLHPGKLTRETLSGRRNRYITPLRLYLSASLVYFLIATAAPNVVTRTGATVPGGNVRIDLSDPQSLPNLTTEQRELMLKNLERAPALLRPLFTAVVQDPAGFRGRVISAVPKAVFVLVLAFAGIVRVFYRRRRFIQHLTFALHVHAAVFMALTVIEVTQFTGAVALIQGVAVLVLGYLGWHIVQAQRVLYERGILGTLVTSLGIGALYLLVWVPVMVGVLTWAVWVL